MAAATFNKPLPVPSPAALPSPRSPTLSDACMILPENDASLRSGSPSPYIERPPSPPTLYTHSNRSERTIKLASAPQGRRGPSPQISIKSPPLSSKSSRSTIRTMVESEASSNSRANSNGNGKGKGNGSKHSSRKGSPSRNDLLASSPTIGGALSSHPPSEYNTQRRLSNASSSIHSEDLENLRWPGFDSSTNFDDSGVVMEDDEEEEEEERDEFPIESYEDDKAEKERREAQADEEYTSAALSRRAEMILANAKKRLNVMEGNLRGARESLVVSPTFNSKKMQTELQQQLAAARERDRRLYAGMGPIPPRTRPFHSSPLSAGGSPGHSRGLSETSVPNPFASPSYASRALASKRASSALGNPSTPWSPEGYGQGRFPIRESRSFEVMREPTSNGWDNNEEQEHSLRSYDSRDSGSPPNALETLPEDDEDHTLRRSASAASDLRTQMQDLKGRISSLKQRAKEDNMRRRSLQSLRTPSPFTSAEIWYSGADGYKNGGSPVTADAGVGFKTTSPVRKTLFEEEDDVSTPKMKPTDATLDPIEPLTEEEEDHLIEQMEQTASGGYPLSYSQQDSHSSNKQQPQTTHEQDRDEDDDDLDEDHDFVSVDGGDYDHDQQAGSGSVYEDAVYEMPVTERHEDRLDAFDYEHFFLHSAMGTYSSTSRRSSSSSSSASSTATTRPVTAIDTREAVDIEDVKAARRVSYHQRNSSMDSVSTVASFATAAEDLSDEEDNEQMDQFTRQLPVQRVVSPQQQFTTSPTLISPRSDSAVNMRKSAHQQPNGQQNSRGSSPSSDLASGLQTSKIYSILLESAVMGNDDEPRLALSEEEKQLIYGLAAGFRGVVERLQRQGGDGYERKELRRRLDGARRVLVGEGGEVDGEPF